MSSKQIGNDLIYLKEALKTAREMHAAELKRPDRSDMALVTLFGVHSDLFNEAMEMFYAQES